MPDCDSRCSLFFSLDSSSFTEPYKEPLFFSVKNAYFQKWGCGFGFLGYHRHKNRLLQVGEVPNRGQNNKHFQSGKGRLATWETANEILREKNALWSLIA